MKYEFKMTDAIRFITERGIPYKQKGSELTLKSCPYCHGGSNNDQWTFAINTTSGAFNCMRGSCGVKGNMLTLVKDFDFQLSDKVVTEWITRSNPPKTIRIRDKKQFDNPVNDLIADFLKSRGISKEIGSRYHLKPAKGKPDNIIVLPFLSPDGNNVQYTKYRDIEYSKSKGTPKEWPTEKGMTPILFGMDQCSADKYGDSIIITEGQMDTLAIAEALEQLHAERRNICSVPMGKNGFTWIPYCWGFLSQFKKIVLFSDYENGALTMAEEFAKRWPDKLYLVQPEDYHGQKDANDILIHAGAKAILEAINNAKQPRNGMVVYHSEISSIPEAPEFISTGIRGLDDLLNGGIPFGGVTIISGKAGEGKTTFAEQIIANAVTSVDGYYRAFIYSEEMSTRQILNAVYRQIAGKDHVQTSEYNRSNGVTSEIVEADQAAVGKIRKYIHPEQLVLYDSDRFIDADNEDETDDLLTTIEHEIIARGIRVVLIDSLMTAIARSGASGFDKYDQQTRFVNRCRHIAKKHNVALILIAHEKKGAITDGDSISGASEIRNLASVVLFYKIPTEKDRESNMLDIGGAVKAPERLIVIDKNRPGEGNTGTIPTVYDRKSKRIYSELDELNREYIPFDDDIFREISSADQQLENPFE